MVPALPEGFVQEISGPETNLAEFLLNAAAEVPDKVCVETETGSYTFAQMARMIGCVRKVLRRALNRCEEVVDAAELAAQADSAPAFHQRRPDEHVVCIVLDRGAESLAAVHAVMLEGCVYNTFDAAEPREKLKTWVEAAQHPVMITSRPVMERLGLTKLGWKFGGEHPRFVLDIDEVLSRGLQEASAPLPKPAPRASDLDRLAYVIFTSGSTGKPKAVMIEHRAACNQVRVWASLLGLQSDVRIAQCASMAFDNHVTEVFGALHKQCTSVVVRDIVKRSGPDMLGWLHSKRVNKLVTTPSHLRSMSVAGTDVSTRALPHLRTLDIGGEALGRDILDAWAPGRRLFNTYGPTEMTVNCVVIQVRPGDDITIGHDMPTYRNIVLDAETLRPCAVGERGVLYTGGVGMARGYLDDEAKTNGKFVHVPGLGRLYCSGDLVSQDASGRFHYHGRVDWQVKVRGIRIELEALEEAVGNVPGVDHCEARVIQGGQQLALIASGSGIEQGPIKEAAANLGKGYMLSVVKIVEKSAWKFNTSGKLVRNHVPLTEATSEEAAAPKSGWDSFDEEGTSELERDVAQCVAQLATPEAWGKGSHFIDDLGLDSAAFGKLITLLRQKPALSKVNLPMLFEGPTVEALARAVESQQRDEESDESDGEAELEGEAESVLELLMARCDPLATEPRMHALCAEAAGGSWTYAQVHLRALVMQSLLRKALRKAGSQTGGEQGVVVLLLDMGVDLLAAMAATLMERHAFCILEPQTPPKLLVKQLCAVRPCAIFAATASIAKLSVEDLRPGLQGPCALVNVDGMSALLTKPLTGMRRPRRQGPLCCVAVTSDAAGAPTVVRFEHSSLHWAAQAWQAHMGILPEDRVLQLLSPNSLPFVVGVWASLAAGATLLFPPAGMKPGADLRTYLHTRHATVFGATPMQLRLLGVEGASSLASLRLVWAVGSCSKELAKCWARGRRIVQACSWAGVPAACVFDVIGDSDSLCPGHKLPLGSALPGCQLHVLNDRLEHVAEGERGTLFIGGAGVAGGYLGQTGAEQNHIVEMDGLGRLFRTGDAAWRDAGGSVALWDADLPAGVSRSATRRATDFTQRTNKTLTTFALRQSTAASLASFRRYVLQMSNPTGEDKESPYGADAWVNLCFVVQSFYMVLGLLWNVLWVVVFFRFIMPYTLSGSFLYGSLLIIGQSLFIELLTVLHLLLAKWLLLGRYEEGDYAIYSIYYLKHWIVERAAANTLLGANRRNGNSHWNFDLGHNFLKVLLLKALGADVALSAHVTAEVIGFDLVSIGPLASVHGYLRLTAVNFVGKRMIVGRQKIGAGATICHGACVPAGAVVMPGAFVEPLTVVPAGAVVEGRWAGLPGRRTGPAGTGAERTCVKKDVISDTDSVNGGSMCSDSEDTRMKMVCMSSVYALFHVVKQLIKPLVAVLTLWVIRLEVEELDNLSGSGAWEYHGGVDALPPLVLDYLWLWVPIGLLYSVVGKFITLLLPVLACRLLPKVRAPMDVPIYHWRAWVAALKLHLVSRVSDEFMDASIQATYWRLCGAKVGHGSKASDCALLPDLLEIGEGCFFASRNALVSVEVDQGRMRIPCKTVIGDGCFMGNENHVVEGLPPKTFCGIRTWVPTTPAEASGLFGNPPMKFGRPAAPESAKHATRFEKFWHHFSSSFIDIFIWKALLDESTTVAFIIGRMLFPLYSASAGLAFGEFAIELGIFAAVSVLSWLLFAVLFANLLYNDRLPLSARYYSTVVTRWFSATKIRAVFPKPMQTGGTAWEAVCMRMMGAQVGRRFFSPLDSVHDDPAFGRLGDDVTADYDARFRQHAFEDHMLKWGPYHVGSGTSILQGGKLALSECGERVVLLRGSVTWKEQALESDTVYEGAPAQPVLADVEAGVDLYSAI